MSNVGWIGLLLCAGFLCFSAGDTHASEQAYIAPEALLMRLPPGVRADRPEARPGAVRTLERVERPGAVRTLERVERPGAVRTLERVELPGVDGAFEVEFTTDPALEANLGVLLAEREIERAHVVVLDPASGALLAYLSTDPQAFPATRAYPAASLMKVVTAAAVLQHKPKAALRTCRYTGSRYALRAGDFMPPAAGGVVETFRTALANSNNQCFARFAARDLGETLLVTEAERVGLLETPAPGHNPGEIDSGDGPFDLGRLGSGLSGSFITPLSAARLAALLASGHLVTPHWIARVRDVYGNEFEVPEVMAPRSVWGNALAGELRELLVSVTREGTARRAFHDAAGKPFLGAISVAGKTGTLSGESPDGLYQWFIGVAPAEAPRIAIATLVVNDPQGGGTSASELAAASLWEVFCAGGECAAEAAERLHLRAQARDALAERERTERDKKRAAALRRAQQLARIHEVVDLDQPPRPVNVTGFEFPWQLRRKKVEGRIVLSVELSADGEVVDASIHSSDLPGFEEFVLERVRSWRFTPPTRDGQPVSARARLPIPIRVN